jgi:hypothetical protein
MQDIKHRTMDFVGSGRLHQRGQARSLLHRCYTCTIPRCSTGKSAQERCYLRLEGTCCLYCLCLKRTRDNMSIGYLFARSFAAKNQFMKAGTRFRRCSGPVGCLRLGRGSTYWTRWSFQLDCCLTFRSTSMEKSSHSRAHFVRLGKLISSARIGCIGACPSTVAQKSWNSFAFSSFSRSSSSQAAMCLGGSLLPVPSSLQATPPNLKHTALSAEPLRRPRLLELLGPLAQTVTCRPVFWS